MKPVVGALKTRNARRRRLRNRLHRQFAPESTIDIDESVEHLVDVILRARGFRKFRGRRTSG